MTTRPTVSIAQLDALEAAAAGELSRDVEAPAYWRIDDDAPTPTFPGSGTIRALFDRDLIDEGEQRPDGRIPAVLTEAGRELLAEFASRWPSGGR